MLEDRMRNRCSACFVAFQFWSNVHKGQKLQTVKMKELLSSESELHLDLVMTKIMFMFIIGI